jgi:putative nucleotidyltransferase with HDIG domain
LGEKEGAMNMTETGMMPNLRQEIISNINAVDHIPALDTILFEVKEKLSGRNSDAAGVAHLIERDLGLSAKILKVANSVYYAGRYGNIGNLQQAIARLGVQQTYNICLVLKTMEMFSTLSNVINLKDFWCHSISVAQVTRIIAEATDRARFDEANAYSAGLFHDIGIFVLDKFLPDVYRTIQTRMRESTDSRHEIEKKLFSIDHGEIGGLILERWKFPENIIRAVSFHHFPNEAPPAFLPLTQLIHLSEHLCTSVEKSGPVPFFPDISIDSIWFSLNINEENVKTIMEDVRKEMDRAYLFLSLEL